MNVRRLPASGHFGKRVTDERRPSMGGGNLLPFRQSVSAVGSRLPLI
jgi:hypothetical protein